MKRTIFDHKMSPELKADAKDLLVEVAEIDFTGKIMIAWHGLPIWRLAESARSLSEATDTGLIHYPIHTGDPDEEINVINSDNAIAYVVVKGDEIIEVTADELVNKNISRWSEHMTVDMKLIRTIHQTFLCSELSDLIVDVYVSGNKRYTISEFNVLLEQT